MRKNTWFFILMVTVAFLAVIAAGCGNGEEGAPAVDDKIVITVAAGAVGQELELTRKAAEAYNAANEGVEVKVLDTPDMVDDRLGLYLQFFESRSPEVDVYQIDVIWPGDLAEHFLDLYQYGAREVVEQHFPAIVENNTVDGKLVGIPWFTDAGLLYYPIVLRSYNLQAPRPGMTWRTRPGPSSRASGPAGKPGVFGRCLAGQLIRG